MGLLVGELVNGQTRETDSINATPSGGFSARGARKLSYIICRFVNLGDVISTGTARTVNAL